MLKGFFTITSAVVLIAVTPSLQAQVYRCETATGIVFADFPCGESAEEIDVDVLVPPSHGVGEMTASVNDEAPSAADSPDAAFPADQQSLNDLLQTLTGQRDAQIGQIDRTLADLRRQVESADVDGPTKADLMMRIAEIESSKDAVFDEYSARTAEAESRME